MQRPSSSLNPTCLFLVLATTKPLRVAVNAKQVGDEKLAEDNQSERSQRDVSFPYHEHTVRIERPGVSHRRLLSWFLRQFSDDQVRAAGAHEPVSDVRRSLRILKLMEAAKKECNTRAPSICRWLCSGGGTCSRRRSPGCFSALLATN